MDEWTDDRISVDGQFEQDTPEAMTRQYCFGMSVEPRHTLKDVFMALAKDWLIRNNQPEGGYGLEAHTPDGRLVSPDLTAGEALEMFGRDAMRHLRFTMERL